MTDRLRKAAEECANDLEAEIRDRYMRADGEMSPAYQRKYVRDMAVVLEVRAALAEAAPPQDEKCICGFGRWRESEPYHACPIHDGAPPQEGPSEDELERISTKCSKGRQGPHDGGAWLTPEEGRWLCAELRRLRADNANLQEAIAAMDGLVRKYPAEPVERTHERAQPSAADVIKAYGEAVIRERGHK